MAVSNGRILSTQYTRWNSLVRFMGSCTISFFSTVYDLSMLFSVLSDVRWDRAEHLCLFHFAFLIYSSDCLQCVWIHMASTVRAHGACGKFPLLIHIFNLRSIQNCTTDFRYISFQPYVYGSAYYTYTGFKLSR